MKRGRDIKVGLFVLAGLVLAGVAIFLIGDERRLFSRSVEFTAKFTDVGGLKADAPVRMGGIDIGHVSGVGYGKDSGDSTIYVTMEIVKSEAGRIKTDSTAQVATKGLLGDKMVEITKGNAPGVIPAGGVIPSIQPPDIMKQVAGMGEKAEAALDNVKRMTDSLADEKFQRDLRESVANINLVLSQISGGDGYPHRFLTDKAEADRISHTLESIDRSTRASSPTRWSRRARSSRASSTAPASRTTSSTVTAPRSRSSSSATPRKSSRSPSRASARARA